MCATTPVLKTQVLREKPGGTRLKEKENVNSKVSLYLTLKNLCDRNYGREHDIKTRFHSKPCMNLMAKLCSYPRTLCLQDGCGAEEVSL